ncbi:MAG: permease [Candidatus Aminicenantaceae bacterium]
MILEVIMGGVEALKEYIALHVLTCLIPAFLLAGAMVSFVSKEAIIRYLGIAARRIYSFFLATFGSFFLAACSCTVIPVASGLYYQGAGVGSAFIILWVAPAANILALLYTGAVLGYNMALIRLVSAVVMAFVVGSVMSAFFLKEESGRQFKVELEKKKIMKGKDIILLLLILVSLLAPNYLIRKGPYLHKIYVWAAGIILVVAFAFFTKSWEEIKGWLKETWWFVKIIFPLLLAGVFIVGIIGKLLPEKFIQSWLAGKGILPSFLATLIGGISYFATMTEAPFVDTLLKLGMGKGPALALLLTGPGMSLPNMLAIIRVFSFKKAIVYIITIIILGTFVGWFSSNFIF